jgi:hypothetical protein
MKIETGELRQVFDALMDHLDRTGQESIDLPWDFYWEIARESRYNPYSEPKAISLGQLSDDWDELLKVVDGDMPAVGYAFVWLSSVLRAVGESSEQ